MKPQEGSMSLNLIALLVVLLMVIVALGASIVGGIINDSERKWREHLFTASKNYQAEIEALKVRLDKAQGTVDQIEQNLSSTLSGLESTVKAIGEKNEHLESLIEKQKPTVYPPYPKSMRINLVHYEGGKLKPKPTVKIKPFKLPKEKSASYESNP